MSIPASAGVPVVMIRRWAAAARRRLGTKAGALSIVTVDSRTMRTLNRRYRRKDRPTNVLSFHFDQSGPSPRHERLWGEVYLCPAVIRREARQGQIAYADRFRWLLQHGLIHLLGLDHVTPRQRTVWAKYEKMLTTS